MFAKKFSLAAPFFICYFWNEPFPRFCSSRTVSNIFLYVWCVWVHTHHVISTQNLRSLHDYMRLKAQKSELGWFPFPPSPPPDFGCEFPNLIKLEISSAFLENPFSLPYFLHVKDGLTENRSALYNRRKPILAFNKFGVNMMAERFAVSLYHHAILLSNYMVGKMLYGSRLHWLVIYAFIAM